MLSLSHVLPSSSTLSAALQWFSGLGENYGAEAGAYRDFYFKCFHKFLPDTVWAVLDSASCKWQIYSETSVGAHTHTHTLQPPKQPNHGWKQKVTEVGAAVGIWQHDKVTLMEKSTQSVWEMGLMWLQRTQIWHAGRLREVIRQSPFDSNLQHKASLHCCNTVFIFHCFSLANILCNVASVASDVSHNNPSFVNMTAFSVCEL